MFQYYSIIPGVCQPFLSTHIYWGSHTFGPVPVKRPLEISKNISHYRQTSDIRRVKSPNLNVSRLVLQLFLLNTLKPDVKSRIKI